MSDPDLARVDRILEKIPGVADRFSTAQLSLFISELLKWNQRLGLVSKKNTDKVVADLLRRSITLWDFLEEKAPLAAFREGARVVDIGSGGGFPGVVWRLMKPEAKVTAVERKAKKAFFLQKIAHLLDVDGLAVEERDARQMAEDAQFRESFDIAVMMAVAPPDVLASAIESLLKPGGFFATLRSGEEAVFPGNIGVTMKIHSATSGPEGPMLLYEKPQKTASP